MKTRKSTRGPRGGGEGDRVSDRRYREKAIAFARSGRVRQAADEARRALRGPEGAELRKAEKKGRAPARRGSKR
jgi:hypothetical protein